VQNMTCSKKVASVWGSLVPSFFSIVLNRAPSSEVPDLPCVQLKTRTRLASLLQEWVSSLKKGHSRNSLLDTQSRRDKPLAATRQALHSVCAVEIPETPSILGVSHGLASARQARFFQAVEESIGQGCGIGLCIGWRRG